MGSNAPTKVHRIVCLEGCHCEIPKFSFPHEYVEYHNTSPDEVAFRVRDATIIITTIVPITAATLARCSPDLEMIAVMATGVDCVDLEACRKRKIMVCNSRWSNIESVSEHTIALYFAVRRRIVELHEVTTKTDEWIEKGSLARRFGGFPPTCSSETLGIIGYGALGKQIEKLAKALGMSILIAERKGGSQTSNRPDRAPFLDVLRQSTVLVVCCPLDDTTRNMIAEEELRMMQKLAIVINVARGGIANEEALVKALREGWIAGAATDVFAKEPASASSSPLLSGDVPNLTVTPHLAWFAAKTIENLQRILKANVELYVEGQPQHVLVDPR